MSRYYSTSIIYITFNIVKAVTILALSINVSNVLNNSSFKKSLRAVILSELLSFSDIFMYHKTIHNPSNLA